MSCSLIFPSTSRSRQVMTREVRGGTTTSISTFFRSRITWVLMLCVVRSSGKLNFSMTVDSSMSLPKDSHASSQEYLSTSSRPSLLINPSSAISSNFCMTGIGSPCAISRNCSISSSGTSSSSIGPMVNRALSCSSSSTGSTSRSNAASHLLSDTGWPPSAEPPNRPDSLTRYSSFSLSASLLSSAVIRSEEDIDCDAKRTL
mmetsp:Transcript_12083/g.17815  ORF Transcript_12083/g.17815 Transcript_12083/m.17815 type:complete len:202 (+) Transcript_12083:153-758(+)